MWRFEPRVLWETHELQGSRKKSKKGQEKGKKEERKGAEKGRRLTKEGEKKKIMDIADGKKGERKKDKGEEKRKV
jgi:hypothetical protein